MQLSDEEAKALVQVMDKDVISYWQSRFPALFPLVEGIRDRAAAGGKRLKNPATPADIWAAVQGTAGKST